MAPEQTVFYFFKDESYGFASTILGSQYQTSRIIRRTRRISYVEGKYLHGPIESRPCGVISSDGLLVSSFRGIKCLLVWMMVSLVYSELTSKDPTLIDIFLGCLQSILV